MGQFGSKGAVEPSNSVAGLAAAEARTISSLTMNCPFFDLIGRFTDRSVTKDNRFTYLPTELYLTLSCLFYSVIIQ